MNILVTGGTGFIGANLARTLAKRGHTVRILGRDFSQVPDLAGIKADLRDKPAVQKACAGMDVVCHVGALSAPWGKKPDFEAINVGGTHNVIAGCRGQKVPRLVHVSSPAVIFAGQDQFDLPDQVPYPKRLTSLYAWSKQLAEEAVLEASKDLEVIAIRPKAVYGEGDRALLPRIVQAAHNNRLWQIGDGNNRVDLTHVDDAVQALVLATEKPLPKTNFPVYTVTGGEHVLLWTAIQQLLERLGMPSRIRQIPLSVALLGARLLEARAALTGQEPRLTQYSVLILAKHQTYDISRIQQDLGYVPQVSWSEGLLRTAKSLEKTL
jgi:2-alkyl-3-oxoalkanoate reductase